MRRAQAHAEKNRVELALDVSNVRFRAQRETSTPRADQMRLPAGCRPGAVCIRRRRSVEAAGHVGFSKMVTANPRRRSSAAQASDAGPAPMQATSSRGRRAVGNRAANARKTSPSRGAAGGRFRWAGDDSDASRRRLRTAHPPGRRGNSSSPECSHREWSARSRAGLPLAIFLMNRGTSMCVGQAAVQGASKQYRQRVGFDRGGLRR